MATRVEAYAEALMAVARAENNVEVVKSEFADFSRAVAGNDQLRVSLSDRNLPASARWQIVDDLMANKASDTTKSLVGMVVSAGRGNELSEIATALSNLSAAGSDRKVATVRCAVALDEIQLTRLAKALKSQVGSEVELDVIIDPSVVGGLVTTIGDTVIDGSVRSRLSQMQDAL